jgi:hypothetical protein
MSRNQTPASRAEMRFRIRAAAAGEQLDAWLDTQPGITDQVRALAHRRMRAAAAADTTRGKWTRAIDAGKTEATEADRLMTLAHQTGAHQANRVPGCRRCA